MNSLMTKSFLSYVELKKQAGIDAESLPGPDIESGFNPFTSAEQENLSLFFADVELIQSEITSISALLSDLTRLNSESKYAHARKLLRGLRDQMDSDVAAILRKAHSIKSQLSSLDASNAANRVRFGASSPVDRIRTSVTNGLRSKLREIMNGFSSLRKNISETCPREEQRNATEMEHVGAGVVLDAEVMEREKAVCELKRSLSRLHQVFLDMAVVVEVQEDKLNDIEENMVKAKDYISGGVGRLADAEGLMRRRRRRKWWLGCFLVAVLVILVCLVFRFAD